MRTYRQVVRRRNILSESVQRWLSLQRLRTAKRLAALGLAAMLTPAARAGDSLWLGGGPTSNWNSFLNWSPLGIPTSADTAYFTSNVAARGIAEFNGGATSVGALVFSGSSSLGVGPYGLKGNVSSGLNIGSILLVTPALNPSGGTNTGASIENMIVGSSITEVDSTCSLSLSSVYFTTGQLSLNSGALGLTGATFIADSVSMGRDLRRQYRCIQQRTAM